MLGDFNTSSIGYTNQSILTSLDIWRSPPGQYARFAEYTNGSRMSGDNIDDTGVTMRVPVPMGSTSDRETLREYTGPATVFDNRVICVAPQLTPLSFVEIFDGSGTGGDFALQGYMTFDSDLPLPLQVTALPDPENRVSFTCRLPDDDPVPFLKWNLTVCVFGQGAITEDRLVSPLLMSTPISTPVNTSQWGPAIYMILNATSPSRVYGYNDFSNEHFGEDADLVEPFPIPPDALVATRKGAWTSVAIEGVDLLEGVVFSATACLTRTLGTPYNVTLTSQSDGPEPTVTWNGALTDGGQEDIPESSYDTRAIRFHLGATANSSVGRRERGVMDLNVTATDWSQPLLTDSYEGASSQLIELSNDLVFPIFDTLPICAQGCKTDASALLSIKSDRPDIDLGHPVHAAMFHDILADTGSPALAVQSFLSLLTSQVYYDSLSRFTAGAEARHAHSVRVFAPQQWKGFIGVVVLLGCHLLVVAWATVWYLRATRHSMLGNSWQAVSQVVSDATLPLLWRASDLNDVEVDRIIRQEGTAGQRYGIARSRKSGRRELVAMPYAPV